MKRPALICIIVVMLNPRTLCAHFKELKGLNFKII